MPKRCLKLVSSGDIGPLVKYLLLPESANKYQCASADVSVSVRARLAA